MNDLLACESHHQEPREKCNPNRGETSSRPAGMTRIKRMRAADADGLLQRLEYLCTVHKDEKGVVAPGNSPASLQKISEFPHDPAVPFLGVEENEHAPSH